KALAPQAVEHVFQPRLLAIGTIALVDEHPQDGDRDRNALLGRDRHAEVAGKGAVAGDAADRDTKVHTFLRAHRAEADVVRILERRHAAAAVERDVELARQAVELAMVEDAVVKGKAERPRVVELAGIDAGGR